MALVSKREVHISTDVDLATTNRLLERIANALEVYLTDVCGVDLNAVPEAASMQQDELERYDELGPVQEEFLAAIELNEAAGMPVSGAAYRLIGLDPPNADREPTAEELDADQPGEHSELPPDEPVTARRDTE